MHMRPTMFTLVYLDRYEGARPSLLPHLCTAAPRGVPSLAERGALMRLGLCLVCLVLYGHMRWGPLDLFHPKLTLLSSGLQGFPERGNY